MSASGIPCVHCPTGATADIVSFMNVMPPHFIATAALLLAAFAIMAGNMDKTIASISRAPPIMSDTLFYGDNLQVLRDHIPDASVERK